VPTPVFKLQAVGWTCLIMLAVGMLQVYKPGVSQSRHACENSL
jgi:hypothetical protein